MNVPSAGHLHLAQWQENLFSLVRACLHPREGPYLVAQLRSDGQRWALLMERVSENHAALGATACHVNIGSSVSVFGTKLCLCLYLNPERQVPWQLQ